MLFCSFGRADHALGLDEKHINILLSGAPAATFLAYDLTTTHFLDHVIFFFHFETNSSCLPGTEYAVGDLVRVSCRWTGRGTAAYEGRGRVVEGLDKAHLILPAGPKAIARYTAYFRQR